MADPLFYQTDDRDHPIEEQRKLVIFNGGNGDWYIGTSNHKGYDRQTVRICTSGGASTNCPGLGIAMAAGVNGERRDEVPSRMELEDEVKAWRARSPKLEYRFGMLSPVYDEN
jgi:hypothetical protein